MLSWSSSGIKKLDNQTRKMYNFPAYIYDWFGESIALNQNGYLTEGKNYESGNYKNEVYNMAVFCGYLFQNRRRTRHSGYYRLQCHGGYCHHRM